MDITEKLKLLERVNYPTGDTTTVNWRLCDPKDWSGDTCEEMNIDIEWWYTPEERDVGVSESFEVQDVKFGENVKFMGKKYRYGQDFPKQLRKYVMEFINPMPSSAKSKFRNDWDDFLDYELSKALNRRY